MPGDIAKYRKEDSFRPLSPSAPLPPPPPCTADLINDHPFTRKLRLPIGKSRIRAQFVQNKLKSFKCPRNLDRTKKYSINRRAFFLSYQIRVQAKHWNPKSKMEAKRTKTSEKKIKSTGTGMQKKQAKQQNKVKNSTYEKSVSVIQQTVLPLILSVNGSLCRLDVSVSLKYFI